LTDNSGRTYVPLSAWPVARRIVFNPESEMDSHPSRATVRAVRATVTEAPKDTDVLCNVQGDGRVSTIG
jgi:hypothetical protein